MGLVGQVPALFVVTQDILGTDKVSSSGNEINLPEKFSEAGIQTFFASRMERYKFPQHYVMLTAYGHSHPRL